MAKFSGFDFSLLQPIMHALEDMFCLFMPAPDQLCVSLLRKVQLASVVRVLDLALMTSVS